MNVILGLLELVNVWGIVQNGIVPRMNAGKTTRGEGVHGKGGNRKREKRRGQCQE